MIVRFAHLCDYASVSQEGKLSVAGIFDHLNVPGLPAQFPLMYLAMRLECPFVELGGTFQLRIDCVDQDGNSVFQIQGQAGTKRPEGKPGAAGVMHGVNQVLRIPGMVFNRPGRHEINILIGGELRYSIPFEVRKITPEKPGA